VLTLLVVTDDENVSEALKTATTLSREHPSRVIGVILGDGRGGPELNAKVRVGESSSGESILLRISGELTKHAESVVLPLLLPDSPVVVWWPGDAPADPSKDAIGKLAQRRLTDAEATDAPIRALRGVGRKYAPGDTDLSWTRLTPWRALLAAALDQSTGKVTGGEIVATRTNPAAVLLVAWLESRLKVPIKARRGESEQITSVVLNTADGDVVIERIDKISCHFSVPGSSPREVPLGARTLAELLAEDLRRLDADEIYAATVSHMLEHR
jgi:glucose-6-phosphate dehydrogenase assembly protein OpcA